ncbi:hypothetical protein [Aquibacillus albus]|uniref:GIY-YIG domain-containing protein n=1 Tax=Aquibacillus albus TaxID=1168171 RepID=A0ABS2MWK3_9BACI|nr:hypothetical protein [Aquibacillus albus]MBM7570276.1 hypothetical protein [Aquibacillus albus]
MINLKFLTVNQITSYFIDEIQQYHKPDQQPSFLTVEYYNGVYYLIGGFKRFNQLIRTNYHHPVPCFLHPRPSVSNINRMLKILDQGIHKEKTNWRFKYYYIHTLTKTYGIDIDVIATHVHVNKAYILNYMIYQEIPDYYKERAIKSNSSRLINSIYLHPEIPKAEKLHYYELAVNKRLSYLQFTLISGYYNSLLHGLYVHPTTIYRLRFS